MFSSACLPHHAPKVVSLEINGSLSPRPPPLNPFPAMLLGAIQSFVNMRSCRLTPTIYHEDLFTDVLAALKLLPYLSCLVVNSSCMDVPRAPKLVQITGINILVLQDPTRAILDSLPSWLVNLTLTELHLKVYIIFSRLHSARLIDPVGQLWINNTRCTQIPCAVC